MVSQYLNVIEDNVILLKTMLIIVFEKIYLKEVNILENYYFDVIQQSNNIDMYVHDVFIN